MVTHTVAASPTRFPDLPPRDDMQNYEQLYLPSMLSAVLFHLEKIEAGKLPGQRRSVYVASEIPVRPRPTPDPSRIFVPDMTVAFDVDVEVMRRDNGYSIENQGKPPELVLEVASPTTGTRDYTVKRDGYARFGISEYWRTDPSGGRWHDAALAGDLLVDGEYIPIPIEPVGENMLRGYSRALRLYVCWEDGDLRFYDPEEGYLPTHMEDIEGRLAEREGRLVAEARAEAAEARARHLEEELRRLQG